MRATLILAAVLALAPAALAQAPEGPAVSPPASAPPPPVIAPTLASPSAPPPTDPQPGATRFDLECVGALTLDGASQPWRRRFSIDLGDRRYRAQEERASAREFYRVSDTRLDFTAGSGVDRATGQLRIEEAGALVEAQCTPQPFTPFPERRF